MSDGCQGGGIELEVGVSRSKLLYTERINSKVLLYSTGSYSISYDKPYGKENFKYV